MTKVLFSVFYRPLGSACVFLDEFAKFLSTIIKLESVLIVGDFNIHVDNPSCNIASEWITLTDSQLILTDSHWILSP